MIRFIHELFSNTVLLAAGLSWLVAQIIKTILTLVTTRRFVAERIFGAGGMPSAHSAIVCSLMMGIGHTEGIGSPVFALTVAFMFVTMYDAMGVRRAAGEQAKVINRVVDALEKEESQEITDKELKESLGHTPLEVLAGALLGILIWIIIM